MFLFKHPPVSARQDGDPARPAAKHRKAWIILTAVLLTIAVAAAVWLILRRTAPLPECPGNASDGSFSPDEQDVLTAVCLSYLTYGCETASGSFTGTVSDLIDAEEMGILSENFGVVRRNENDPATALFDTSDLIRGTVGHLRCLCAEKDEKSSFFGAAFCDDERKCVWIAYAGSVSFRDALTCAGLVLAPRLTAQEKAAFDLYADAAARDEVARDGYRVILTGHSLGGALAAMVSAASGCPAVTVNGADGLGADKILSLMRGAGDCTGVHNFLTRPEKGLSFMEFVERLMFLGKGEGVDSRVMPAGGLTTDTHSAFSFIRFRDGDTAQPYIPEPEA